MLRQADDVTQVSRDHDRARDALLPRLTSRDHCRDSINIVQSRVARGQQKYMMQQCTQ